jgi:starch synthase
MPKAEPKMLRVLFLAAEADPLIKVGGLGDVAGSLPRTLRQLDVARSAGYKLDVRIVIPFHHAIRSKVINPRRVASFSIPRADGPMDGQVLQVEFDGVPVYLIDGPPFRAEMPVYLYDTPLDGDRYTFFSLAALEAAAQVGFRPDIIHANDWHTSMALYALKLGIRQDDFFDDTRSMLTVHNLPFMGGGSGPALKAYGLPATRKRTLPQWARHFPLPLGLLSADHITTVSPTYSAEILTPEFGCGLQDFLRSRSSTISGVLNGLDQSAWDPATDTALVQNYSPETLELRRANKQALLAEFELSSAADVPLFILIGRMDPQKGVDLALEAFEMVDDLPWQAIVLGTGDPLLEAQCRQLEARYPDRLRAAIRFDARLSRRMYAGGDILLMPSRYEPCGLAQMIGMRYGCIPLARATGGLQDTIQDHQDAAQSTGFLFGAPKASELAAAMRRAHAQWQSPETWQAMQHNGMQQDFSWERSAEEYARLYIEMIGVKE